MLCDDRGRAELMQLLQPKLKGSARDDSSGKAQMEEKVLVEESKDAIQCGAAGGSSFDVTFGDDGEQPARADDAGTSKSVSSGPRKNLDPGLVALLAAQTWRGRPPPEWALEALKSSYYEATRSENFFGLLQDPKTRGGRRFFSSHKNRLRAEEGGRLIHRFFCSHLNVIDACRNCALCRQGLYGMCRDQMDLEALKVLIVAGANIHLENGLGKPPIFMAAVAGRPEMITLLAEAGADVNWADPAPPASRNSGETPLYVASSEGHVEAVRALLRAGADVNKCKDPLWNGWTPLMAACHYGHCAIAELLLKSGADQTLVSTGPVHTVPAGLTARQMAERQHHDWAWELYGKEGTASS